MAGRRELSAYYRLLNGVKKLKTEKKTVIMYGFGSAHSNELRELSDRIIYLDVIPKEAVLRA